jgi:hypothetical protein
MAMDAFYYDNFAIALPTPFYQPFLSIFMKAGELFLIFICLYCSIYLP